MPGVIRAKGPFWLATRPDWIGEFSLAGAAAAVKPLGIWWTAVPPERWPGDPEIVARARASFDPVYGDRRQEIVFIGMLKEMKRGRITSMLDRCLIPETSAPFKSQAYRDLSDPFPVWE